MKEFSASCEDHGIALLVNHLHTPPQNCFVERVHRTFDEELYQALALPDTLSGRDGALEEYVYSIIIIDRRPLVTIVLL